MPKIRSSWFDSEGAQRSDINDLAEQQQSDSITVEFHTEQLAKLGRQVAELQATLAAALDALADRDLVTEADIRVRREEQVAERAAARSAAASSPYRGAAVVASTAAAAMVKCGTCGTMVSTLASNYTEDGLVCDRCFAKSQR